MLEACPGMAMFLVIRGERGARCQFLCDRDQQWVIGFEIACLGERLQMGICQWWKQGDRPQFGDDGVPAGCRRTVRLMPREDIKKELMIEIEREVSSEHGHFCDEWWFQLGSNCHYSKWRKCSFKHWWSTKWRETFAGIWLQSSSSSMVP